MNTFRFAVLVTLFSLLVSACAPLSNKYYPVNNTSPRVSSLGFYISPPPGRNWYEKHLDDSLYYFKRTSGKDYALTTKATELSFDAPTSSSSNGLLEYVNALKNSLESQEGYQNCSFNYSLKTIANSHCIRYEYGYDDYGNKKRGRHPFVKVFKKGLVCMHPQSPTVGIDLGYTEQSFPAMTAKSFRTEGEKFISSLNFYSLPNY